jgi:hypothetical protein
MRDTIDNCTCREQVLHSVNSGAWRAAVRAEIRTDLGSHLPSTVMDRQNRRFLGFRQTIPAGEVRMAPNNQSGRRPRRRVKLTRNVSPDGSALTEGKRQAILQVMAQYGRFGPKQVHAELRRTRHDITLDLVELVFKQVGRRESVLSRLFRR